VRSGSFGHIVHKIGGKCNRRRIAMYMKWGWGRGYGWGGRGESIGTWAVLHGTAKSAELVNNRSLVHKK